MGEDGRLVADLTIAELLVEVAERLDAVRREAERQREEGVGAEGFPEREFALAQAAAEDCQMRATRGFAKLLGAFAPADLEKDEAPQGEVFTVALESESGSVLERRVRASDSDAALAAAEALWPAAAATIVAPDA